MKHLKIAAYSLAIIALASCKKKNDSAQVSIPQIQIGQAISSSAPLIGAYKGTMLTGNTYTVNGDITVNAGDTLLIQKGVKVNVNNGATFIVKGTLLSLGTSDAPVTITDPRRTKMSGNSGVAIDSAYKGGWGGIYADKTCKLLVVKWTHLDFPGAALKSPPFTGPSTGDQYAIYWQGSTGYLVFEDSWIYGTPDDAVRFYGGNINMMRNTLEKCGGLGGDGFNAKGGTQGNMAYNLIIGGATNGTKGANDGAIDNKQCQLAIYNNTYINDGHRNKGVFGARGGCIEVENNSRALAYNNLMVDCNFGLRIAGGNNVTAKVYVADTLSHNEGPIFKTAYGNNFFYASAKKVADQFLPTNVSQAVATIPQSTDIPNMAAFLGKSYTLGLTYDGAPLVGKNDPLFVNYPLPNANYLLQASVDNFNFRLQSGSPAIGKGKTNFSGLLTNSFPVSQNFGSSGITPPGKDIGCYQMDGSGNQH
jgi:hypothetical protein